MIRWLICLSMVLWPNIALAQEWAKAKLEKSTRHGEWVKLNRGKRTVEAFVVYPEVKDKATAVVVIHEIFGLADWVKLLADELAEAGYIAIAPDLMSQMGPKGGGTAEIGGEAVRKAIKDLPPVQIKADLNAAADYVSMLPSCNGKVVACGFCWGGSEAFRFAANTNKVKAVFPFYGGDPNKEEDYVKIACPIYAFYAANDNRVNATLPKTTEMMKKAGKKFEPVMYETGGHGFMRMGDDPNGSEGNKKARDEAWKRWKELLKAI